VDKPKIEYPCTWWFKVIGSDREGISQHIISMLQSFEFDLSESRQSRSGKYLSFNLSVHVKDEQERNAIFQDLKKVPTVKFIL